MSWGAQNESYQDTAHAQTPEYTQVPTGQLGLQIETFWLRLDKRSLLLEPYFVNNDEEVRAPISNKDNQMTIVVQLAEKTIDVGFCF